MGIDPSLDEEFADWDLGALMLEAIERSRRQSDLHLTAEAVARCFRADMPTDDLEWLLATLIQIFLPVDQILDGEEHPLAREIGQVRTALMCVATAGLLAERVAHLDRPHAGCREILKVLGRTMREAAAGQDRDATNDATEAAYWEAVAGAEHLGVAASMLGALLAGAPPRAMAGVRALGHALGRIDQVENDVEDFLLEPPRGDWARPSSNLVMLYGLTTGIAGGDEIRSAAAGGADRAARDGVRARLLAAGAGDYAAHVLRALYKRAWAVLDEWSWGDSEPLIEELRRRHERLAWFTRRSAELPIGAGRASAEAGGEPPGAAWPLRDEIRPALERARTGSIAEWAALAAQAAGGRPEAAQPAMAILSRLIAAIRVLDDWQDGEDGLHRSIGGGRTANLAIGLAGEALVLAAELPLDERSWRRAVTSIGRGFARTLRGQDLDLTAPLDENGYWLVADAKTPPLLATALTLGALLGGASADSAPALSDLARPLGRLLQVCDDIADALATPRSSDWMRPERNLLLLYAVTVPGGEEFRRLARQAASAEAHRAARRRLLPDALLYALDAVTRLNRQLRSRLSDFSLPCRDRIEERLRFYDEFVRELHQGRIVSPH